MKSLWHKLILVLIFALPLAGCGGGGAPSSGDSLKTDVVINSVQLTMASPDIDTVCSTGLTRTDATMNIDASPLNPDISVYNPFPISVESCTITYLKGNEDPAAPVIESLVIYPNCGLAGGLTGCPITLMDIQRKRDWANMVLFSGANLPAEIPAHYVARVKCSYVTRYGKTGDIQVETAIWLADFNSCI